MKKVAVFLAVCTLGLACTYEDRGYETKSGQDFAFWHIKCLAMGATEKQAIDALGEPSTRTHVGNGLELRYSMVRQRESVDRVFGLIPMTFRQEPEEVEAIVVITNGAVSTIRYRGPDLSCDRDHDNDGKLITSPTS